MLGLHKLNQPCVVRHLTLCSGDGGSLRRTRGSGSFSRLFSEHKHKHKVCVRRKILKP
jgi:hypothetical protein